MASRQSRVGELACYGTGQAKRTARRYGRLADWQSKQTGKANRQGSPTKLAEKPRGQAGGQSATAVTKACNPILVKYMNTDCCCDQSRYGNDFWQTQKHEYCPLFQPQLH